VNLLLDTNVLSEVQRSSPNLKVLGWLDTVDRTGCSSASLLAELRRGIALMDEWPPTRRAGRLGRQRRSWQSSINIVSCCFIRNENV
jgi:predicted nucleic acid-binding protein